MRSWQSLLDGNFQLQIPVNQYDAKMQAANRIQRTLKEGRPAFGAWQVSRIKYIIYRKEANIFAPS